MMYQEDRPVVAGLVAAVVGLSALVTPLNGRAQMTIPAQFSVSPSGSANYSIPISVPPGTGGLTPSLALTYNSQSGNGLLGVGWALSGLSSITRCPRTLPQDGVRGIVGYDTSDRYCLDGQRLIVVSGVDGASGSDYRVEQESYAKVTSYGETGATGGPGSFVVKTKAGLTMEYGKSADSRIEAQGKSGVIAVWALNKVIDVNGNSYTVAYTKDQVNGAYYPAVISFARGSIQFSYGSADRPDPVLAYSAGVMQRLTKRLESVQVIAGGASTAQYAFTYRDVAATVLPTSVITQIQVCANGACLPGIAVTSPKIATADVNAAQTFMLPLSDWGFSDRRWWVDIDGDGRKDYCRATGPNGEYLSCMLATASGMSGQYAYQVPIADWGYADRRWWVDFDGDGRDDYCRAVGAERGSGSYLQCTTFGAAGITKDIKVPFPDWGYSDRRWWVDVDGDGRQDYCRATGATSGAGSYLSCALSTGSGVSGDYTIQVAMSDWGWSDRRWWVDVNGDGMQDYCRATGPNPSGAGSMLSCMLATGIGFSEPYAISVPIADWGYADRRWWVDFNGDGLPDYCRAIGQTYGPGSFLSCKVSTGAGFGDEQQVPLQDWGYSDRRWWVDVNGDKKLDYCRATGATDGSGSFMTCTLSPGASSSAENWIRTAMPQWGYSDRRWFLDVDGDGQADYCRAVGETSGAGSYVVCDAIVSARFIDQVTAFSNGVSSIGLTYATLPQSYGSSYTGTAKPYPSVLIVQPIPIITAVQVSNGAGGYSQSFYKYADLIAEVGGAGRGSTGFKWMQVSNASTGLVSRTCYRQDWPYIGLVDKVLTATSEAGLPACNAITDLSPLTATGSNLLSLSLNKYTFTATNASGSVVTTCQDGDAATCASGAIAPGKRYQVYGFESYSQSRDWDGTNFIALPANHTTQTQDSWGNVTSVMSETLNADGKTASGYSKTTTNTYLPADTSSWLLGRLQQSQVKAVSP